MNISKAETLIVYDKDGTLLANIKIGMVSLSTIHDKSKVLEIRQSKL